MLPGLFFMSCWIFKITLTSPRCVHLWQVSGSRRVFFIQELVFHFRCSQGSRVVTFTNMLFHDNSERNRIEVCSSALAPPASQPGQLRKYPKSQAGPLHRGKNGKMTTEKKNNPKRLELSFFPVAIFSGDSMQAGGKRSCRCRGSLHVQRSCKC